jgi:hypothetical protein
VTVTGWQVEIHLRIPLDEGPGTTPRHSNWRPHYGHRRRTTRPPRSDEDAAPGPVSSKDGLRSLRTYVPQVAEGVSGEFLQPVAAAVCDPQ